MRKALLITVCATAMMMANAVRAADCPAGVCGFNRVCECSDNGRVIKAVSTYPSFSATTYTYDANGYKTSEASYYSEQNFIDNKTNGYSRYTYDANGNMIVKTSGYHLTKPPLEQWRYTYDANGNRTSETRYLSGSNTPYYLDTHVIDKNGSIIIWGSSYTNAEEVANHISEVDCSGAGYVAGCTGASQDAMNVDYISFLSSPVVCVEGYIDGCVAGSVKLADGSSAMVKNGQMISKTSPDGSTTLFNEDGTIKGFKGKRIYTTSEANAIAKPTGNTVRIKYR